MRFSISFTLFFLFSGIPGQSQSFEWNAGYDGFLDNREYYSIDDPQTIFGSRLWGEIGADLDDRHSFRAGFNYLYEFGYDPDAHIPGVIMYYRYRAERINFLIGAFPRRELPVHPLVFLSDTLNYFRPNMEGTFVGYSGKNWQQHVFIDWTGRQTDERHERFIFGFSGNVRTGMFFLEDHFIMAHLAGKGIPDPEFHLRDNGGLNLNIGVDVSERVFLDTLIVRLGGLISLDRIRGVDPIWQTPAGFLGQLDMRFKSFGLNGLYYRGEGHHFFYGDPFYRLKHYGRIDLYFMPFRNEQVNLRFDLGLHFTAGDLDYSQQILLDIKIR